MGRQGLPTGSRWMCLEVVPSSPLPSDPEADAAHRKMALVPVLQQSGSLGGTTSRHIHLLPVGSPCLHCCSTKPSWPQTNLPANLRNQHCNRRAWKKSHSRRLGSDSPCRGLCSTTPSLPM